MSTALRRLVTVLGFRINKTGLGDYEKSINSLKKNVNQLSLSFNNLKFATRGIFFGNVVLSGVALGVAKTAKSLDDLSQKVGLSVGSIQILEASSQKLGNSYGEITKTMSSFADKVSNIKNPILRLNTLQSLMIEKNKKLSDVFNLTSESFKKLNAESAQLVNVFSQKNIQDSKEYIKSWSEFRLILDNIRTDIGLAYMPMFNELSLKFKNWYLENRDTIKGFSIAITSILGKSLQFLSQVFETVLNPIRFLIRNIISLEENFKIFSKTLDGVGMVFSYVYPLFLPFGSTVKILSTAFVFLNTVIEDFVGWMNGVDSVFGSVFGSWNNTLDKFNNSLKNTNNLLNNVLLKPFNNIIEPVNGLYKVYKQNKIKVESSTNDSIPSIITPNFSSSNQLNKIDKNKNINLTPSYSIKIDNISVGSNISFDQAKSFGDDIGNIIKDKIEFIFLDMVNNLKS